MEEIWKDIKGFEGYYKISNLGNVMSLYQYKGVKNRILKYSLGTKRYPQVSLQKTINGVKIKNTIAIHRLVGIAFIDNPYNKEQINHKDGNKNNNLIDNLEWVTNGENVKHSYDFLGRSKIRPKHTEKTKNKLGKKVGQYDLNGNLLKIWNTVRLASVYIGCDHSSICKVCNGISKSCYGYIWKYI